MANSKGKNRRVEASDEEDEAGPSTRMQTDGEESEGERNKKDKGKGRAVSRPAIGTQVSVKAEKQQNGAADHEDDQEDDGAGGRSQQNEDEDDGREIDLDEDQGALVAALAVCWWRRLKANYLTRFGQIWTRSVTPARNTEN